MSLVNVSHVCSHLQNASLARLGLTSIPYSRLHLSLSLLLLKQGFISQLKLGGPSPPASCFPPGLRDSNAVSSHPYAERGVMNPEGALQRMVSEGWTEQRLRDEGYQDQDVEFALSRRLKSKEQLQQEGWDHVAFDALIKHMWSPRENSRLEASSDEAREPLVHLTDPKSWKTAEQMAADGLDPAEIALVQSHQPLLAETWAEVTTYYPDEASAKGFPPHQSPHFRLRLHRKGLPISTLAHFAGPTNSLRSIRDLERDGLEIDAMGLTIPNQPYNPPPASPTLADPLDLETEGLVTQANRSSRRLWLGMKYWDGLPVLRKARMISKPTKRYYLSSREIGDLCRGRGAAKNQVRPLAQVGEIMAVVTERGVLEARECVERGIGGMVLCRIW